MGLDNWMVLIIGIASPFIMLLLGLLERRQRAKRIHPENILDYSSAMKNISESWVQIKQALEDRIEVLEREGKLKDEELKRVKAELNSANDYIHKLIEQLGDAGISPIERTHAREER